MVLEGILDDGLLNDITIWVVSHYTAQDHFFTKVCSFSVINPEGWTDEHIKQTGESGAGGWQQMGDDDAQQSNAYQDCHGKDLGACVKDLQVA